jgi:hypothetical protein
MLRCLNFEMPRTLVHPGDGRKTLAQLLLMFALILLL